MPVRRRQASNLFNIVSIWSDKGQAVLRDMIELYRQETEVVLRPGLEPEKCHCPAERNRKIDRFVNLTDLPTNFDRQGQ